MSDLAILTVDIGGNNLKIKHNLHDERRKAPSGSTLTPQRAVELITELRGDWEVERISIGVPGAVENNRAILEPANLGDGWVGFDFEAALGVPTRVVNDALMQAIGSYEGGKMLFLGLGTGLGAALVTERVALPLEFAHVRYRGKKTYEDLTGNRGLVRDGRKAWETDVHEIVARLRMAMIADYVVLGGGNAKLLKKLPTDSRLGSNANAFVGGFRIWHDDIIVI